MEFNIEGEDEIKDLFKSILGPEVRIKDNLDTTEELLFINTINKLQDSHILEESLFEDYGISIAAIIDPLWEVIENDFTYLYGDQARETISWYIHGRFDSDGKIVDLEQEDGKLVKLLTPKDLWDYIKFKTKQP